MSTIKNIEARYQKYFLESDRLSSAYDKKVYIVRPDLVGDFLAELLKDERLTDLEKLYVGILISGGFRHQECYSLKKEDFYLNKEGHLYGRLREVLKKRKMVLDLETKKAKKKTYSREFVVLKEIQELALKVFKKRKPFEYLFRCSDTLTSSQKFRYMKDDITSQKGRRLISRAFGKLSGLDNHAFRHTRVSHMIFLGLEDTVIARLMEMDVKNVQKYAHIHSERYLSQMR